jgi:hypothetical protein
MAVEYDLDFRARPECYRIGRGEAGVFKVQPYKSELLPLWSFRDEAAAKQLSQAIWAKFEGYREGEDFVGMDLARKYLQMGWTRAMRYAKYPGGRKRAKDGTHVEPQAWADAEKRRAAVVFKARLDAAKADPDYQRLRAAHKAREAERPTDCP